MLNSSDTMINLEELESWKNELEERRKKKNS